jgi:cytochrome P450
VTAATIPTHVPQDLVRDFDIFEFRGDPRLPSTPFEVFDELRDIRTFWSSHHSGYWVLTRAEDIREVFQKPEVFSNHGGSSTILGRTGWPRKLIPEELDPPEHMKYRRPLALPFSPGAVTARGDRVEQVCRDLIESVAATGSCEFLDDFARPFPTTIFTEILGIPTDESPKFLRWNGIIQHSHDPELRARTGAELTQYLIDHIEDRSRNPKDDLTSHLLQSEVDGKPMSKEDALDTCFLMFMAGLDTVTAALGFIFRHLAEHPEDRRRLVADPELVPLAVEELLRAYAFITLTRLVKEDVEVGGVQMKAGDPVVLMTALATRDPLEFPDPATVDIGRAPNHHMAFGAGPHRCVGSHLARRELNVAVREWLRRIPDFEVAPGASLEVHASASMGLESLPLVWEVR